MRNIVCFFFFLDCGIGDIDWRRGGVPGDSHDYCVSLLQAKKEVNKRYLQPRIEWDVVYVC